MSAVEIASGISAVEQSLRLDLAAAYRLVAHFSWDDLLATHISVRIPGEDAFLINPFGMLFDEITPTDLVKVDMDGNILGDTAWGVNAAGFVIHSAIHAVRHDAQCVMHLHTPDGIAVSALKEGLLPLNQTALLLTHDIAFHDFEGIAVNLEERERLARDLGDRNILILRNHGTLALGPSIADAFSRMYFLETACTIQVRTLSMGRPLHMPAEDAVASVTEMRSRPGNDIARRLTWPALIRKLDRIDPAWRG